MDRHRIELQLRGILVTYRIEQRRRDSPTMDGFRERARSLLHSIEIEARAYPDLRAALRDAHRELDSAEPTSPTAFEGSSPDVNAPGIRGAG